MPLCPQCHRTCPKDVAVCRECGASLDRGVLRRLLDWWGGLFVVKSDYEPTGGAPGRMAGPRTEITRREVVTDVEDLPPELREMVEDIRAGNPGGTVRVEHSSTGPITINENGVTRTFESVEDLPPDLREKYGPLLGRARPAPGAAGRITVNVGGRTTTYDSVEDMPPELREKFEAMRAMHREDDDR